MLNAESGEDVDGLIRKLDDYIFNNFPDVNHSVKKLENGAPITHPIEIRLSGQDRQTLFSISKTVKNRLKKIAGVKAISDNWGRQTKKFLVNVDEARAQSLGVNNSDIAQSMKSSLNGYQVADYREGDKIIPIILKAETLSENGTLVPTSLNVFSQSSQATYPMDEVADYALGWESPIVFRRDRALTMSVSADLEEGKTATEVNVELRAWIEAESDSWPPGFRWEFGGEAETSGKANDSISEKLPIAGLIILLLLMFQFNSYRKTGIILLMIPLSIIGVVCGLLLAQSYMGFMTLLGIISLAGIVINNAIVLIDRIQYEESVNGLALVQAIPVAAKRRLRPILLTTATTVLGMIPLWLGGGVMWEPMAVSIIFGLLGATVLTLGLVPVLYSIFYRVKFDEAIR